MIRTLDILIKAQRQAKLNALILERCVNPQAPILEDGIYRLVFNHDKQEIIIEWSGQDSFGSHKLLVPASLSYSVVRQLRLASVASGQGLKPVLPC